jgi:hypothetical protein
MPERRHGGGVPKGKRRKEGHYDKVNKALPGHGTGLP